MPTRAKDRPVELSPSTLARYAAPPQSAAATGTNKAATSQAAGPSPTQPPKPAVSASGKASTSGAPPLSDSPLNSFLRGALSIADNIVPDDMPGVMGPFGVPVRYGAAGLGATYTSASNFVANATTWGLSALPGGTATTSWDQAGRISPGRMLVVLKAKTVNPEAQARDKATFERLVTTNKPIEDYTEDEKRVFNERTLKLTGQGDIAIPEGFDITNPLHEQWLFGDTMHKGGQGSQGSDLYNASRPYMSGVSEDKDVANMVSGLADAAATWFLDPLVVFGKGIKVVRFGTRLADIGGKTVRATSRESVIRDIERSSDEAIEYIESGGTRGSYNWMSVTGENIARRNGRQLQHEVEFQGEYGDELRAIADTIDDEVLAIKFAAAAMGNTKYIDEIFTEAPAVADALASLRRANSYEYLATVDPQTASATMLLNNVLDAGLDSGALLDDLVRRDAALRRAVSLFGQSYAPIAVTGSRAVAGKKIAQAWRAGKADRELARNGRAIPIRNAHLDQGLRVSDAGANEPLYDSVYTVVRNAAENGLMPMGIGGAGQLTQLTRGVGPVDPAIVAAADNAIADVTGFIGDVLPNRARWAQPTPVRPAVIETTYQISSNFRKVAVWEFVSGQRGSGWLEIRGMGAGRASEEWEAALTDSRALRSQRAVIEEIKAEWIATPANQRAEKAKELERRAVKAIARSYGLSNADIKIADTLYEYASRKRAEVINLLQSNKSPAGHVHGVDPADGTIIAAGKGLRSQLETSVPIIDFRLMDRLLSDLADPANRGIVSEVGRRLRSLIPVAGTRAVRNAALEGLTAEHRAIMGQDKFTHSVELTLEQILSAWKAGVLIRVGYPLRNSGEGMLRSIAVLGVLPQMTPVAVARGAGRLFVNRKNRVTRETAERSMADLAKLIDGLERNRKMIEARGQKLADKLGQLQQAGRLVQQNPKRQAKLQAAIDSLVNDYDAATVQLDDLRAVMDDLAAVRDGTVKRRIGWDEAFAGELGEVTSARASASVNTENFLESAATRDLLVAQQSSTWVKIDPPTLPKKIASGSPAQFEAWLATPAGKRWEKASAYYWQGLADVARQYRADPFGALLLRTDDPAEIAAFWTTKQGKAYANDMGLFEPEQIAAYSEQKARIVQAYYPTPRARELAQAEHTTAAQFRGELAHSTDLVSIHGHGAKDTIDIQNPISAVRSAIFDWIATRPDSALVRHPFYNEVWNRERDDLRQQALATGANLNDPGVIAGIDATARRRALDATNKTLFTIQRYSNPAAMLRFVSPFFAAWENSIRTWTGIVVKDPSVLARANILWGLPNELGLVVDENGKKVPPQSFDFLSGSKGQYIVLPEFMADAGKEMMGGVPFAFPKGGANVVTPGEAPLLPGTGPVATVLVSAVLAGRPDTAEAIRQAIGDDLFSQIAPFLKADSSLLEAVAPPWVRKAVSLLRGTDDERYLTTMAAISKDAMVEWRLSGGDKDDMPTYEEIKERTDRFFVFSTLASLGLPAATMRMSEYQPQLDYWQSLQNAGGTFEDNLTKFIAKFGDNYLPLTSPTSDNAVRGLSPSVEAFVGLKEHEALIRKLNNSIEGDVGVLAATLPNGEYSPAVASYLADTRQPGTNAPWRSTMEPEDIQRSYLVSQMWGDYLREKTLMQEALAEHGIADIRSAAARDSGIAGVWRARVAEIGERYGDIFNVYGPQGFSNRVPRTLATIRVILSDADFQKSDLADEPVWVALKDYMRERGEATAAYNATTNQADRKAIKAIWGDYTQRWRLRSLAISDFYDTFLENDDLGVDVAEVGE